MPQNCYFWVVLAGLRVTGLPPTGQSYVFRLS